MGWNIDVKREEVVRGEWGEKVGIKCLEKQSWDFRGGPAVKTPRFPCRGRRFDPWSGN